MQLTFLVPLPNWHWDTIHEVLGQRRATNLHFLEEHKFSIVFANIVSKVKNLQLSEISVPVNHDVANATKQNAKGSYKCVRRK